MTPLQSQFLFCHLGQLMKFFYHLHLMSILHTLYFPHSCGLEWLFSFPAQPPFPPEAVTLLLLDADVLVGKLECPRTCPADGLPRQPTSSCMLVQLGAAGEYLPFLLSPLGVRSEPYTPFQGFTYFCFSKLL